MVSALSFFKRILINLPLYSAATDNSTGDQVAIKKVCRIFEKAILAKRALREVKLLKFFNGHENVRTHTHTHTIVKDLTP